MDDYPPARLDARNFPPAEPDEGDPTGAVPQLRFHGQAAAAWPGGHGL